MDNSYTAQAPDVIAAEFDYLNLKDKHRKIGLAFSGGGIRSASFGMGVMQALVADDKLKDFDYLSTVSGGGYLGSSLTWFLSQKMDDGENYGTSPANFPFGRKRQGGKDSKANVILDFIRQHGNYLIPGTGINAVSLLAVSLRTMLVSFAVYFGLTMALWNLLFVAVNTLPLSASNRELPVLALALLIGLAIAWIGLSLLYSLMTYFKGWRYILEIFVQRILGALTLSIMIVAVVYALLMFHKLALLLIQTYWPTADGNHFGASITVSSFSVISGSIMAFLAHLRMLNSAVKNIAPWQIVVGAALLLFGMLYGSYVGALLLQDFAPQWIYPLMALAFFFGVVCNLNYFGLNRMYRDRLMEAFMPNRANADSGNWGPATDADKALLQNVCGAANPRPYHLINCNIVLPDARAAKYRGRMGDSFTLSRLYCGSDATGWRKSSHYMHSYFRRGLTLPTAMGISGAAANPNAGVAGQGVTTNRLVSTLMSLLNLRLGYWANNPRSERTWVPPNYIYPGIKGGISPNGGLTEHARCVELSDGGHFENLAIYELLRRQMDLIVVSDAGADPDYEFSDLANAVERVRVDFGINIVFEDEYPVEEVIPGSDRSQSAINRENYNLATRCFAVARIEYAADPGAERKIGHLIYIKPTLIRGLSADVLGYRKQHATFPNQTTMDQFFSEQQFEAYRELGYYLGWSLLVDRRIKSLLEGSDKKSL